MINIFFFFLVLPLCFYCSLHAYTPHPIRQASTLSLFNPPLQKKDLSGWTMLGREEGREGGCENQKGNEATLKKKNEGPRAGSGS